GGEALMPGAQGGASSHHEARERPASAALSMPSRSSFVTNNQRGVILRRIYLARARLRHSAHGPAVAVPRQVTGMLTPGTAGRGRAPAGPAPDDARSMRYERSVRRAPEMATPSGTLPNQ